MTTLTVDPQIHLVSPDASDDGAWARVLARDASADFFYAVTTTGIVCRPTCPSRRPARQHVRFFASVDEATAAGFRACLRCRPENPQAHPDAVLVKKICNYLRRNVGRAVTLEELGGRAGISGFTLQRKFERVLGVTPRQFQMDLRAAGFRNLLSHAKDGQRITDAVYEAGYSASSRLYSDSQERLGMTPSRFRDGGCGETIEFVATPCALGFVLVAATAIGVCWVALGDSAEALEAGLRQRFRHAAVAPASLENTRLQEGVKTVLSQLTGSLVATHHLPLDLRATVFQQRVWRALSAIPRGETRSYSQIATELGQPTAARAVARACASNPVALLVPCHRVVGATGDLTGYRWGKARKESLLELEKNLFTNP
jgi:AraC family transcriptional regulator of adaptative response/methylated-DNA-[protein]-cysteine methyltransferase